MGEVSGFGVAAIGAGAVFVYGGIKGKSPLAAFHAALTGKDPSTTAQTQGITAGTGSALTDVPPPLQTHGGGGNDAALVRDTLAAHGASKACIAGFQGNFELEASFSTTSFNPNENAIGWAQWEGGRRTRLQAYAAKHGLKETDPAAQAGFLWLELSTTEAATWLVVKNATNPQSAAATIDSMYERSKGTQRAAKMAAAQRYYDDGTAG